MTGLTRADVEAALIPRAKSGSSVTLLAGVVTGPRLVDLGDGPLIVDGPTGPVGQQGYVLNVDGHRYWLPHDGTSPAHLAAIAALTSRVAALERVARGSVTVAVSGSAGGTVPVAFPPGRFTAADQLSIQLTKVGSGLAKYIPYVTGVSATGMTVGLYSGDGSVGTASVVVHWAVTAY